MAVSDDGYVYHYLIYHMIQTSKGQTCRKAFHLLKNEGFIRGRVLSLGIKEGVKKMMADVKLVISWFQSRLGKSESELFVKGEALLVFDATCSIVKNHKKGGHSKVISGNWTDDQRYDIGMALVDIGIAMQGQDFWLQALDIFSVALDRFETEGITKEDPFVMKTLELVNASSYSSLALVPRNSPECITFKNASQLRDLASGIAKPSEDGILLELSSHPGQGVVLLRPKWSKMHSIEYHSLGISSKDISIRLCADGKRFFRTCDGAQLTIIANCKQDDIVYLTRSDTSSNITSLKSKACVFDFVVNDDGSISPCDDNGLAFGIGKFPLLLVQRNSPNRLIFKHGKSLCNNEKQTVRCETCEEKCFPLKLSSHPGFSINLKPEWPSILGIGAYRAMHLGPIDDAVHVSYDGRLIKSCKDGAVFRIMEGGGFLYNVGTPVMFFRGKTEKITSWKGGINDFIINEEGSISPMHARSLALGCTLFGRANSIVTKEEKELAERETKSRTNSGILLHKYWKFRLALGMLWSVKIDKRFE